ncbi:MAG TPA: response regulator [Chitinophagales bacterium]|nr:response regulator [Chitinophagales bacterium]
MQAHIEVLLVEDNPDDAMLAIRALKKEKLANHLLHVKDGAEALDFIYGAGDYTGRDTAQMPRVILLDLKMPKVNGLEVLARLKSDTNTASIPIVILTSSDEDPDIKRCYQLGANSYIVKPVEFTNFATAIASLGFYWMFLNQPCFGK